MVVACERAFMMPTLLLQLCTVVIYFLNSVFKGGVVRKAASSSD